MDMNLIWNKVVLYLALTGLLTTLVAGVAVWARAQVLDLIRRGRRAGFLTTLFSCVFALAMTLSGTVTLADKADYFGGGTSSGTPQSGETDAAGQEDAGGEPDGQAAGDEPDDDIGPRSAPMALRRTMGRGSASTGIPETAEISENDYAAGAVLSQVVLDETHDFTPPADAVVFDEWCRFGAEYDWFRLAFDDDLRFCFAGTNLLSVIVYSQGFVRLAPRPGGRSLSPLGTVLGFAPAAVRLGDGDAAVASRFWYRRTEIDSMVLTWENALLGRDAQRPVSFQMELFTNGDVVFRYDLSRAGTETVRDVCVGISNAGVGRLLSELSSRVTTLRWSGLNPSWAGNEDPDGDSASTSDEVFVLGTDPANADSDGDGLADGQDTFPTDPDADGDGVADGISAGDYRSHPLWGVGNEYATGVQIMLNAPVVAPAKAVLRVGSLPIVLTTNAVYRLVLEEGVRYDVRLTTNRVAPVNLTVERELE